MKLKNNKTHVTPMQKAMSQAVPHMRISSKRTLLPLRSACTTQQAIATSLQLFLARPRALG
jgi:hypothetical protein